MLVAVDPGQDGAGTIRVLDDAGAPLGPALPVADLAAEVARREAADAPRWLWASTATTYPRLLRQGVHVARCHDLELAEALLLGHAGRWGEPRGLGALWARRHGRPVPADASAPGLAPHGQDALFDDLPTSSRFDEGAIEAVVQGYADQLARIATTEAPGRFRLLVSVESAGGLLGAEMGHDGLPWHADEHDAVLAELLGEAAPPMAGQPRRLRELTEEINAAFGGVRVHPESPAEVLRAFSRAGIVLPSTRAYVLRGVDHPAVPLLLEFKELYRIWTAHGWAWRAQWVHDGRFKPEYVPGGVVSGRWATRGGGALQIPKVVRRAVVADPEWTFVVADASQLEPRVLAAMAGDTGFAAAARAGDLYDALAAEAFAGDRAKAKLALLGAMYGQTGGAAVPALAALQARFPVAWEFVERAARTGEGGGLVRSWLGRTCPPSSERMSPEQARARGRFTRNFVVQATAAEWALALLAAVRSTLPGAAQLVFFQHDEVVVHTPREHADEVAAVIHAAGERAAKLLFGESIVRFPLDLSIVDCYADAK